MDRLATKRTWSDKSVVLKVVDATGIDADGCKLMPSGCSPSDPRVQPSKERKELTSPSLRDCQLWRKRVHVGIDLCPAEYNTLWVQGQQPKCLVDWNVPTSQSSTATYAVLVPKASRGKIRHVLFLNESLRAGENIDRLQQFVPTAHPNNCPQGGNGPIAGLKPT